MDKKLYKAARKGDVSCLSGIDGRNITEEEAMLIQDGKFLNRTQHGNNNILHIAARAGRDTFVAEARLRFPFLSDQVNKQGDTPLLVAARFGHLNVVETLAEPNNEFWMQDDMATAVENGTNSRSSRHQLEHGTIRDNVATLDNGTNSMENGTNSRDMTTALENETNSSSRHRPRDVEEGLDDHQFEQGTIPDTMAIAVENGTNSRDMTTALENETNSSSRHRPRDVEEGLNDHQLEEGILQDGMATAVENGTNSRDMTTALENETNSSSRRHPRDVEEGLNDHQLEDGILQDGMATAVENGTNARDMATAMENETNSSSRCHPRDVEEGLDDHQLEQGTIQDHMATAVENGTNSRGMATALENKTNLSSSRRRPRDVEELDDRQLEESTIQDGMTTAVENGTNARDMGTALENETNSSSRRRPRDVQEGLDDHQFEQGTIPDGMAIAVENGTNSRDMTTALENEINSSSRRCPRDVEEGLNDHQFEEGTLQDGMATTVENGTNMGDMATAMENETNSSSRRHPRDVEEGLDDHQFEQGTIPDSMAIAVENGTNSRDMTTALENETNSSSRRRPRDVEEGLNDHKLEEGTLQDGMATAVKNGTNARDMATAMENETNSSSRHRLRDVEEGLDDHQLEQGTIQDDMATVVENGTNSRGMATALENKTNLSSSRRRRPIDVEEGLDDHQLEEGTVQDGMATAVENGTNSRDMATALENETNSSSSRRPRDVEEGLDDHQLDVAIPSHWRVTNEQGTTITTALHEALKNGHQDVARHLLRLKPEMADFDNLAGESPLFLAAESHCELFMLDILLSQRPYSTNGPDGLNALHASRDCCGAIISLLIEKNPDLMRQLDNRGKAAIHHAVEAYCWDLLDRMLIADASMALFPDDQGYTPLLRAASGGNWRFYDLILYRCPESIEARNPQGQNALHLGKVNMSFIGFDFRKMPEMWELLNVGDDKGNTPLHLAVKENQYEKALLLTSSASIDLGAVNKEGLTALDLCESDCEHYTTKRQLWFHLMRHGARRGRHPNLQMIPRGGPNTFLQYPPDVDWKLYVNTTALIAILIATITFAAAFTVPGGYDTNSDNLGGPTLVKRAALRVFILSDTLAMCCSITAVFILTAAMRVQQDALPPFMAAGWLCLNIALLSTLVAFMSGMFAVLAPKASWVAILVCIVCSITAFLLKFRRHEMSPFTWFMPILPRDILLTIRKRQRMKKRTREQSEVRSVLNQIGSPDTTYHVGNTNAVAS